MRYNRYRSVDYRNFEPVNALQQSVGQSGKRVKYYRNRTDIHHK